jgi:hypothetical protein
MATNHSSSHAFNPINDTHREKVVTLSTYSWDVKNTHNLIFFEKIKIENNTCLHIIYLVSKTPRYYDNK